MSRCAIRRPGGLALLAIAGAAGVRRTQLAWYGHTPDRAQRIEVRQEGKRAVARARRSAPAGATAPSPPTTWPSTPVRPPRGVRGRASGAPRALDRRDRLRRRTGVGRGRRPALRAGRGALRLRGSSRTEARWRMVVDGVGEGRGPFEAVDADLRSPSAPDGRRVGYVASGRRCGSSVRARRRRRGPRGDCAARSRDRPRGRGRPGPRREGRRG